MRLSRASDPRRPSGGLDPETRRRLAPRAARACIRARLRAVCDRHRRGKRRDPHPRLRALPIAVGAHARAARWLPPGDAARAACGSGGRPLAAPNMRCAGRPRACGGVRRHRGHQRLRRDGRARRARRRRDEPFLAGGPAIAAFARSSRQGARDDGDVRGFDRHGAGSRAAARGAAAAAGRRERSDGRQRSHVRPLGGRAHVHAVRRCHARSHAAPAPAQRSASGPAYRGGDAGGPRGPLERERVDVLRRPAERAGAAVRPQPRVRLVRLRPPCGDLGHRDHERLAQRERHDRRERRLPSLRQRDRAARHRLHPDERRPGPARRRGGLPRHRRGERSDHRLRAPAASDTRLG